MSGPEISGYILIDHSNSIRMLEVDVKKKLRDFDLELSIQVAEGEIFMLVGDNGCGKTTLLNLIAGLTKPDEGKIGLHWR